MVYKRLKEFPPKKTCNFCMSRRSDELELGEIAHLNDTGIYCHYFCLLLSNEVLQRGKDNQGILGFLPVDIKKEVQRGKKLKCTYCKRGGATIQCSKKSCYKKFHLPCGLKRNSLHQFFGHFKSFCSSHRPGQLIPPEVADTERNCVLCQDPLQKALPHFWPECCRPSVLIHRRCLQRMALEHGYSFKCPLCNDTARFLDQCKNLGIYIPEQDSSWEREAGAYLDLLDRRVTCELGSSCLCDNGTSFSRAGTKWKLERCSLCGSSGIHLACSTEWMPGSKYSMLWSCETCSGTRNPPVEAHGSKPSSDEEMEIVDVETIDEDFRFPLEPSKPKPRETEHSGNRRQPYVLLERCEPYVLLERCDPYILLERCRPYVVSERRENMHFLRSQVPIVIDDSDDEIVSISSTEDDVTPHRPRPSLHRVNMPRPIIEPSVLANNQMYPRVPSRQGMQYSVPIFEDLVRI
ncbi:hypothetical protein GE061_019350 [Apolygus lucorum]|uniref:Uncharacterized protein n=1 Tax=Apolygus lucorum TaxID=248454 RepID=A0A6A4JMN9_APOLU|nr:hypothetical protein GE061_019350 [Apolygus lucorum]